MTDEHVIQVLKSEGYSDEQIEKLRKKDGKEAMEFEAESIVEGRIEQKLLKEAPECVDPIHFGEGY